MPSPDVVTADRGGGPPAGTAAARPPEQRVASGAVSSAPDDQHEDECPTADDSNPVPPNRPLRSVDRAAFQLRGHAGRQLALGLTVEQGGGAVGPRSELLDHAAELFDTSAGGALRA